MLLLIVWIVVVVLALAILGAVAFGVLGAAARLRRELESVEREVRPLVAQAQATAQAVAAARPTSRD